MSKKSFKPLIQLSFFLITQKYDLNLQEIYQYFL